MKEYSSIDDRKLIAYDNEYECISTLLSEKQQIVYLIISATLARIVIPPIHDYVWVENIYIHQDHDMMQSITWMDGYSKIRGSWTALKEVIAQIEPDIALIEKSLRRSSDSSDILSELWVQKCSNVTTLNMSHGMKQMFEMPIIVTLCSIQPAPFVLHKEGLRKYQFRMVEDCHTFLEQQSISSIFLIIIDDGSTISDQVQSLIKHHSIHAAYIYCTKKKSDEERKTISMYNDPKVNGIFSEEKDLLVQMTADTCLFSQISMYTPKMTMLKVEFDILTTMDNDKQAFLNFQFFIDILQQLWGALDVPLDLSDRIRTESAKLSADLHVNTIELIQEIDKLNRQFDPSGLVRTCAHLHHINEQLESSALKAFPFITTLYRAQLLSHKDLEAIEKNTGYLLSIQTLVLAYRSFASTKRICRRACDIGLTVVMLEINIPKQLPLTYLDSDTIIFPISTVFKIISVTRAPDAICHVQLELADTTMDLMRERLYCDIGYRLTWLTFPYYLFYVSNDQIAKEYFKYLQSMSLDADDLVPIHGDTQLINLFANTSIQDDFDGLTEMKKLIELNKVKVSQSESPFHLSSNITHDSILVL